MRGAAHDWEYIIDLCLFAYTHIQVYVYDAAAGGGRSRKLVCTAAASAARMSIGPSAASSGTDLDPRMEVGAIVKVHSL